MKGIKIIAIALSFFAYFVASDTALSQEWVTLYYGNPDGTPIEASINSPIAIDVYAQTSENAYVADIHICLGTDDMYIDSLISSQYGEVFAPLNGWDMAYFLDPSGSPPNPDGWSSQSLQGFANLAPPFDAEFIHSEDPVLILRMVGWVANDSSIMGQTVNCLGVGINPQQGPSNAGDTLGGPGYPVTQYFSPVHFDGPTSIGDDMQAIPGNIEISQNYPNPFNANTLIEFALPEQAQVSLTVYDVQGRLIETLAEGIHPAGNHQVTFNSGNLPSGIYFYSLQADSFRETNKMILLK
ncbi:MAG: T9SS type A sorting domain-containing protein [candidate division Zixibacteria bacterium]|nr:T9SS type A sorting domain-containing protein [candidate division Zixibacteria bacterium]